MYSSDSKLTRQNACERLNCHEYAVFVAIIITFCMFCSLMRPAGVITEHKAGTKRKKGKSSIRPVDQLLHSLTMLRGTRYHAPLNCFCLTLK